MGILVTHHFTQLYHLKGFWDASGKVAKQLIHQLNVTDIQKGGTRFDNAWDCYSNLEGKLSIKCINFDALVVEGGPDLLDQVYFTVTD